jgi:hypothetical protein
MKKVAFVVGPVGRSSPVELIRASSDQVRRAAQVIAQISADVGFPAGQDSGPLLPASAATSEAIAHSLVTIMIAQRSAAAAVRVERTLAAMDDEVLGLPVHCDS